MTDDIILRTGRSFYANCNIVGIDGSGEVHEGYDGGVYTDQWTPEDRTALAEMMIARWIEFSPDALPAMIAEAVAKEREACAAIADEQENMSHRRATSVVDELPDWDGGVIFGTEIGARFIARTIRSRKDTPSAP